MNKNAKTHSLVLVFWPAAAAKPLKPIILFARTNDIFVSSA